MAQLSDRELWEGLTESISFISHLDSNSGWDLDEIEWALDNLRSAEQAVASGLWAEHVRNNK